MLYINCKIGSHGSVCARFYYTIQHRTVLIVFPVIGQFWTVIIAQILSTGDDGDNKIINNSCK